MRVIAGKARRLELKTPPGVITRPTTDRVKETLFNILQPSLFGSLFLDLFAGSGGIGIEAISRGARKAVFIDNDRKAISCIKDNLQHTKLADQAEVISGDAISSVKKLSGKGAFDIIFMDPPYDSPYIDKLLELFIGLDVVDLNTLIIAESLIDKDFSFAENLGYEIVREKIYKSNKHVFLQLKNNGGNHA